MKRQATLLIAALFFTLLPHTGHGQELVRLSFGGGWDALPAIVGQERGFFDQEQLVVSGLAIPSARAVMTSLANGSVDFAAVPQRTLLVMAAAKLPVKVAGMNGWATQMDLIVPAVDKSTGSVADLKGKTVAIGTASEAFPVFIRLLNAAGVRPGDVMIKSMEGEELVAAFKTGTADAIFEMRYYTAALVQNGQARTLLPNEEVIKVLGTTGAKPLVANAAFLQREPETAQKFLRAWIKALIYIQRDPEDAARLLQIFFDRQGTPVQTDLAKAWVGYTRYDRYIWSEEDILDAEYNGWGLQEGGVLKVAPELDGYIDNRFAQSAWQSLQ